MSTTQRTMLKTWWALVVLASTVILGLAVARADETAELRSPFPQYMSHNGSLMHVDWSDNAWTFTYAEPRPSLWGVGVRPGTVLMQGNFDKNWTFQATAVVFSSYCGAIPYQVSGTLNNRGWLVLQGAEPVFDGYCRVLGYKYDTNSSLVFVPQEG